MLQTSGHGVRLDSTACSAVWPFIQSHRQDAGSGDCFDRPRPANDTLLHGVPGRSQHPTPAGLTARSRFPTIHPWHCLHANQVVQDGPRVWPENLQALMPLNKKTSSGHLTPRCSIAPAVAWRRQRGNGCCWCSPRAISTNTFASNAARRQGPKRNRSGTGCSAHKLRG
jgi:hypothetical protein